jgi:hypothetical protein
MVCESSSNPEFDGHGVRFRELFIGEAEADISIT